jgi:hypothetical protein
MVPGAMKACDMHLRLSMVFFPAADFDLKPHNFLHEDVFVQPDFGESTFSQ